MPSPDVVREPLEYGDTARHQYDVHAPGGDCVRERGADSVGPSRDDAPGSVRACQGGGHPRPQFQGILRAAPPASIDPAVDPDDVFDMLLEAVLTRTVVYPVTARHRPIERTVEMILRLLRPPAAVPAGDPERLGRV